jgi:hypothetical protein
MTAFFIPGVADDDKGRGLEHAYSNIRKRVELDMGRRPRSSRIAQLWARRGSLDCVTEVGMPDPLCGGTVMAIFDMGPHQPFVVWRQPDKGIGDGLCEVLACTAYSVLEFDS